MLLAPSNGAARQRRQQSVRKNESGRKSLPQGDMCRLRSSRKFIQHADIVLSRRSWGLKTATTGDPTTTFERTTNLTNDKVTEVQGKQDGRQQFSFTRAWYPAFPVAYLDQKRPQACSILGKKLVVWADAQGHWRCLQDSCPHRLAPLSEGRLVNGNLMCSYHGWEFDKQGSCVNIPQLPADSQTSAIQNKRSCAQSFPTLLANGLLYIWPDASPTAHIDSAATPPNILPELANETQRWGMHVQRNSVSVAMEQSMDPSHAMFLHHGQLGLAMKDNVPMKAQQVDKVDIHDGFEFHHGAYSAKDGELTVVRRFIPPCTMWMRYTYPSGKQNLYQIHHVAGNASTTRIFGTAKTIPPPGKPAQAAAPKWSIGSAVQSAFNSLLPRWWSHTSTIIFMEQDLVMQRRQEAQLPDAFGGAYFMPAPADFGIIALKQWMRKARLEEAFKELGLTSGPPKNEDPSEEDLTSTFNYHTRHCAMCKEGMVQLKSFIDVGMRAAAWLAAVSLVAMAAVAFGKQVLLVPGVMFTALAVLAVAATHVANTKLQLLFNKAHVWRKAGGLSLAPRG